ncbi:piggyBac transposable element-derived protein 4-like protein [Lates japonicus]|uniref:PiggyBac transposable element-derived protein 4-like protein n=1 Tax=Lates japonicus TaxID=270547 RepID=A0AAD3QUU9_LATJO|nr:piggyBac transposable element-derived protein 4-like protein [Lates japonicus]
MSLQIFHMLSRVIHSDSKDTRLGHRQRNKPAAIQDVCPFKQYMLSKPRIYGIENWAACDARTSYAWNTHELLWKTLTTVGTVRQNKPERPPALLAAEDKTQFSSKFAFTEMHILHVALS